MEFDFILSINVFFNGKDHEITIINIEIRWPNFSICILPFTYYWRSLLKISFTEYWKPKFSFNLLWIKIL